MSENIYNIWDTTTAEGVGGVQLQFGSEDQSSGNQNAGVMQEQQRFGAAASIAGGIGPSMLSGGGSSLGPPKEGENGNWKCLCGNVNYARRDSCNRCHAQKPDGHMGQPGVGMEPYCGYSNQSGYGNKYHLAPVQQNFGSYAAQAGMLGMRTQLATSFIAGFSAEPDPIGAAQQFLAEMRQSGGAGLPMDNMGGMSMIGGGMKRMRSDNGIYGGGYNPSSGSDMGGYGGMGGCGMMAMASKPRSNAPEAGVNGNWKCGTCGNVNFPRRTHCNGSKGGIRCGIERTEEQANIAEAFVKETGTAY